MSALRYLGRRLVERTTWAAVGAAIPAGALLPPPWSYVSVGIAALVAMLPSPGNGSNSPGASQ